MRHLIKTQIIEVTTDNPAGAFELQHKLSSLYYRVMLPLIEKTFNQLEPGNRILYLDSIAIDLGVLTMDELDKNHWTLQLTELLSRQIKESIQLQSISENSAKTGLSISGQWLYYMQHGYLPWNTLHTDNNWYDNVLAELATDYGSIEWLRQLITSDEISLRRIVLSHLPAYLGHLTEVLTRTPQANLVTWMNVIEKMPARSGKHDTGNNVTVKFIQSLWTQVLMFAATATHPRESEIVRQVLLRALSKMQLMQLIREKALQQLLEPFMPFVRQQLASRSEKPAKEPSQPIHATQPAKNEKIKIPAEGVFVKYAGLVILHPFLAQFFKFLQLTNNGKFTIPLSHRKALGLLHCLATGDITFEEHELVVHKILCGYPVNEPVDPQIEIAAADEMEAEQLLENVIGLWSILKNTSITAIRESFLQRGGKLVNEANGDYRLIVEPDSLDVLLDHLPWSLSIVRLPWMTQVLKVDWK